MPYADYKLCSALINGIVRQLCCSSPLFFFTPRVHHWHSKVSFNSSSHQILTLYASASPWQSAVGLVATTPLGILPFVVPGLLPEGPVLGTRAAWQEDTGGRVLVASAGPEAPSTGSALPAGYKCQSSSLPCLDIPSRRATRGADSAGSQHGTGCATRSHSCCFQRGPEPRFASTRGTRFIESHFSQADVTSCC